MIDITANLPPEAASCLTPNSNTNDKAVIAHTRRLNRFARHPFSTSMLDKIVDRRLDPAMQDMPFLTADGIRDTFEGTDNFGAQHRYLAPLMQEIMYYGDISPDLFTGIDRATELSTEQVMDEAKASRRKPYFDVVVIGSGPHGTSAATFISQNHPQLRTLVVDQNPQLGGGWRNNGPNPSLYMNSRVRKANYKIPPIPRTPGNINPMGRYATLELADVVSGNYALDTELGNINAVNAYLAADDFLMNAVVTEVKDRKSGPKITIFDANGEEIRINAGVVINAPGIRQNSTLAYKDEKNPSDGVKRYFTTQDLYKYFGNAEGKLNPKPLEIFNDQIVAVVGSGDSALTALEALLGNLPPETYGQYGPGRYRPSCIYWIGAPGETAAEIEKCLRSRYKNGIIQALPKTRFGGDQGAIIIPVPYKATACRSFPGGINIKTEDGARYPVDYLIDCTNKANVSPGPIVKKRDLGYTPRVYNVGPGANLELPVETQNQIAQLGIGENTVALWALMSLTDDIARQAGIVANGLSKARAK